MQSELHSDILRQGVLVVEDSLVQRQSVMELVRSFGVDNIQVAEDGHAALVLLREMPAPPAIAIVDLEMPGMDGIDLLQNLALQKSCPALLITSSVDATILGAVETMVNALNLPLLGVINKPLTIEKLQLAITKFNSLEGQVQQHPLPDIDELSLDQLHGALLSNRIFPHYQPKLNLETGTVDGLEALSRCVAEDGKMIPPACFIAVAERCGLIDELTLCILDRVLDDMFEWGLCDFLPVVAINISAQSLSNRPFADEIIRHVSEAGIAPSRIVFELTESALVTDLAAAIGAMGRLRLKGFGLSIDDYGTGFSSMQQLSRLPFTELKIDRSFVRNAHEKPNLRAILASAIDVGHRLGLSTVAEGIETREELALLVSLDCRYAQGYLIARPMPADEIVPWRAKQAFDIAAMCADNLTPQQSN